MTYTFSGHPDFNDPDLPQAQIKKIIRTAFDERPKGQLADILFYFDPLYTSNKIERYKEQNKRVYLLQSTKDINNLRREFPEYFI